MKSLLLRDWQAFLRYEDLPGEKPASLYLTGLGISCHASFASVVAERPRLLAHRSVFVDLLGCGFSDGPTDFGYSLEEHADTVARLLDELDLSGCNVIGYSMGGAVAITLAATRPDLVSRLVLMEANLDPGGSMVSRGIAEQTEEAFCAHGFQALVQHFRQAGIAGAPAWATVAGLVQVAAPHALHRSAVGLVRGTRPTMREWLLQMTIPRTFIVGEQSLPAPKSETLPKEGVAVLAVPGAGHLMAFENPSDVAEAINTALGRTP
jgi:pimeloyl-ACP methyl ester carboxylesterase